MKRSVLKRGSKGLARTRKPKYPGYDYGLFFEMVCTEMGRGGVRLHKPCLLCHVPAEDAHHVLAKQTLAAVAHRAQVPINDLLMDPRNGVPLCRRHHDLHTSHAVRIPFARIPPDALAFADALDRKLGTFECRMSLERHYRGA